MAGADLYTVWNTDSSGAYTGNPFGAVSGSSSSLEALEPTFHQDLNGDGTTGIPTAVIEALGSTSLVQLGSTYYLNPVGGGTGPQIKFGGSVVSVGQLGGWNPIAAEISGGGYQIAWKMAGADLYTVWNTDSSGNYVGNAIGAVPGGTASLETLETSFHQDLNGDSTIGVPSHTSPSTSTFVPTSMLQDSFHFADGSQGGTGAANAPTPAAASGPALQSVLAAHDVFVFADHLGPASLSDPTPATDTIVFGHTAFANQAGLPAAVHDLAAPGMIITDSAQDVIASQHITTADLLAHLAGFHLV